MKRMKEDHKTREKRILYIVLLLLLAAAYFLNDSYVSVGGFDVGYYYLIAFFIIAAGLGAFLWSPAVDRFIGILRLSGILAVPFLVCLAVSALIYVFSFTEVRQMISGFFEVAYMLIAILTAGSILYLLEERAVPCLFWGVSLGFSMIALMEMREVGVGEFFRQFFMLLTSGASETLPAMGVMEAPCFAYSYGMFFLYFACFRKQEESRIFWGRILVCAFFLLLGLKRSALLAMAVGLLAAFLFQVVPPSLRKFYFHAVMAVLILTALLIIPFIRYSLFTRIAEFFGVNLMGRDRIYQYYADYYEISPFYFGRGLGWVADFLRELSGATGYEWMTNVHDEYVRSFIELGFWGYFLWVFSNFLWIPKKTVFLQDAVSGSVIIGCTVYFAVMYITENIFFRFTSTLVWAVIIMASCRASGRKKRGCGQGAITNSE